MTNLLGKGDDKPLNNLPPKSAFITLAIYSQKKELKVKSAKISAFWHFQIAIIRPKFKKNH